MDERFMEAAAHIESAHRDAALARVQRAAHPQGPKGFDGTHCVDCDEAVPEARLRLECYRCIACQSAFETAKRRGLA